MICQGQFNAAMPKMWRMQLLLSGVRLGKIQGVGHVYLNLNFQQNFHGFTCDFKIRIKTKIETALKSYEQNPSEFNLELLLEEILNRFCL